MRHRRLSLTAESEVASFSVSHSHAAALMVALLGVYSAKCETLHHLASEAVGHGYVTAELRHHRAEFADIESMTYGLQQQLETGRCQVVVHGHLRLITEIAHSVLRSAAEELSDACASLSNVDTEEISRCIDAVGVALDFIRQLSKSPA